MKKILLILLSVFLLVACSSVENDAKKQFEATMKELAKDASSMEISNVKTIYKTDSICILHAKTSGKNGLGGVTSYHMEYIYLVCKDEIRESVINLDEDKSIMESAKNVYRSIKANQEFKHDKSPEEEKEEMLRMAVAMQTIFDGRQVPGTGKEEEDNGANDMKKW